MIYTQKNTARKLIEVIVVIVLIGMSDQLFQLHLTTWELDPLFFFVLLFSLRYGLTLGLLSFFLALIYHMMAIGFNGGDIYLLFYDMSEASWIIFSLLLAIVCGLSSTSFQERYESLHYRHDELKDENEQLTESIKLLEHSQKTMQEKMLEFEHSLTRIYQVGKALDQSSPELIRNEAISIISNLFKAKELAIYHLDSSKRTLRLHIRKGDSNHLPQTVFIEEDSAVYKRLFRNKTITLRTIEDENNSPVLVGPIIYGNEIKEVLVIYQVDFAKLTTYEIQIMSLVLDWMSSRIEKATELELKEEKIKMFQGTNIYFKEAFEQKVQIQKKRSEKFDQSFSVIHVQFAEFDQITPIEAEIILRSYLREIDLMGYDPSENIFSFLLPGTAPENAQTVKERIKKALTEKGGLHAG
ncbi:hypothetical protein [Guptibacillus spartinae]|uniref:hypothetical protein n=1 Tax=Guptibacillus spartinae TaxID=3025679 RepID=UPI0023615FF1|nr:hypothetical protein [Pseudalkalibacillus spartinae]